MLVVILGFSFLDCSVLMLLLHFMSWLLVCVCVCVFLGCLFRETITESLMGMANRERSIYFSGFLIIGVFGWKQLLSPRATLFSTLLSLKNPASKRWKRTPVFNFVAGNAIKIGVSEFFWETKVIHDYLRFWFFSYIFLTRNYTNARFLGVFRKGLLNMKNTTKIGVSGLWGEQYAGPKTGEIDAFKTGVPRSVREWGAYVARRKRPLLNALEDKPQVFFLRPNFVRIKTFHRGKTRFLFESGGIRKQKKKEHFWTLKMKKNAPKLNTTAYIYIYIYMAEASKCAQVFPAWILWDVSLDALGVGFQYIQLKSHFWP